MSNPEEIADLIEGFEEEILDNRHSLRINFGRSKSRRKLVRFGQEALKPIADYFKEKPPNSSKEFDIVWGILVLEIVNSCIEDPAEIPTVAGDIQGWIDWIENFIQTKAIDDP